MPKLGYHLMYVSELCKLGMRVVFHEYTVSIQDRFTGKEIKGGSLEHGVYKLHGQSSKEHGLYKLPSQSPQQTSPVPVDAVGNQLVDQVSHAALPLQLLIAHSSSLWLGLQPGAERGC